jgi:hypothetical protein
VPAEKRPTVWGAPAKERLALPDMSAPQGRGDAGGGAVAFAATTPAGWEQLPPKQFRDLRWRVAGQEANECWFTAGVGGGLQANLTRWYSQAGRQDVQPAESMPLVELAGRPARLLELEGTIDGKPEQGMLVAFAVEGDMVTTLKMTGPKALVAVQKESMLAVAKSIRPAQPGEVKPPPAAKDAGTGQAPPPARGAGDPHGDPHGGLGLPPGHGGPTAAPFTATIPAGWTAKAGSPRALHHAFGQGGEVYVAQLGGTIKPMLDMWRGEVSLPALSDAEFTALPKVPMLGGDAVLLDQRGDLRSMTGAEVKGARVLIAVHLGGGTVTFAKLFGRAEDVEAQVEPFKAFCASLRRAP